MNHHDEELKFYYHNFRSDDLLSLLKR